MLRVVDASMKMNAPGPKSSRTQSWERPDTIEGPLRRGRERPERSSAVLLGRRPDKDAAPSASEPAPAEDGSQ